MMIFAQISDLHIDNTEHSVDRATRVLNHLNDLPGDLDAILVTGDIADHGLVEEYRQAAKILTAPVPVLHCPGNHDVRANYRIGLSEQAPSDAPINQVHRLPGATFLMCDSSIPGEDPGLLTEGTLAWLDDNLRNTPNDTPAFVCFHHPPVAMHQPYLDTMLLTEPERLAEVITPSPTGRRGAVRPRAHRRRECVRRVAGTGRTGRRIDSGHALGTGQHHRPEPATWHCLPRA